jgi:hypothetical protein
MYFALLLSVSRIIVLLRRNEHRKSITSFVVVKTTLTSSGARPCQEDVDLDARSGVYIHPSEI